MLTARTITDEQILRLRDQAFAYGNQDTVRLCNFALLAPGGVGMKHEYEAARARCAEILNTRAELKL